MCILGTILIVCFRRLFCFFPAPAWHRDINRMITRGHVFQFLFLDQPFQLEISRNLSQSTKLFQVTTHQKQVRLEINRQLFINLFRRESRRMHLAFGANGLCFVHFLLQSLIHPEIDGFITLTARVSFRVFCFRTLQTHLKKADFFNMNPFAFTQMLRNLITQSIDCSTNIRRRQGRTGMDFLGYFLRSYSPIVNNFGIILFRLRCTEFS